MKKIKVAKTWLAMLSLSLFSVIIPFSVNADTLGIMERSLSVSKKGPDAYSGKTTKSGVTKMTKTTGGTVTIGDVTMTFNNLGWLRSDVCVEDSSRTMVVDLMEEDSTNSDDLVKSYTWSFNGLHLSNVSIAPYNSNTAIDAAGDSTVELYLSQTLNKISGDKTTTNGELYYYRYNV